MRVSVREVLSFSGQQYYRTNLYGRGTLDNYFQDRSCGLPVRPVISGR